MNNDLLGRNAVVRDSGKARNRISLKALLFFYSPSIPHIVLRSPYTVPWEILIYDVEDYIRHSSNAYRLVISGMLFKIWRVFFFSSLRLMAFLNTADCIFVLL